MTCWKCGTQVDNGCAFCTKCGASLAGQGNQNNNYNGSSRGYTPSPYDDYSTYSTASGRSDLHYVVLQVTLKEKFLGTGSGNLSALENVINEQAAKGYRLHTIATATGNSTGFLGGDRIQATMVFEKMNWR